MTIYKIANECGESRCTAPRRRTFCTRWKRNRWIARNTQSWGDEYEHIRSTWTRRDEIIQGEEVCVLDIPVDFRMDCVDTILSVSPCFVEMRFEVSGDCKNKIILDSMPPGVDTEWTSICARLLRGVGGMEVWVEVGV